MPLTSYCKKCGKDVPVSAVCPDCGAKLPQNTVRLAWCVDHTPIRDWMCWNAVMRIVLPVMGATVALALVLQLFIGGPGSLSTVLSGALGASLAGMLILLLALLLLVFLLMGDDLLDCAVDARGVHVQQYLPNPTPLKLLLRLKSPQLMQEAGEENLVFLGQKDVAWKDVQRVQLWPEKTLILLYAPKWWMRLSLPCTPFTWEDALSLIREKIGKKKNVVLPPECVQAAPPRKKAAPKRTQQLSFDDIPPQPIPEEEVPPPAWTQEGGEQPEDFTPLADVLDEIRRKEDG